MSKKIVIYDKDPECLELFGELLTQQGYKVLTISNFDILLDFLNNNPADIIVSDAEILFHKNQSLLNQIKEKFNQVPVLYLSDKNQTKHLKNVLQIQQDRVIEKPVVFMNLIESVNREFNALASLT
ncbi:MAG: response regulator [Candidatus Marinimicrobia bacterium]|nr:response regulator [Candidatus Neomarinimicrobiota bacterium]